MRREEYYSQNALIHRGRWRTMRRYGGCMPTSQVCTTAIEFTLGETEYLGAPKKKRPAPARKPAPKAVAGRKPAKKSSKKKKKGGFLKKVGKGAMKYSGTNLAIKGTKAAGKGIVKGGKAVGRGAKVVGKGIVKGAKATGKALKKMGKVLAALAKKLAKAVVKLFNKFVVKNIMKMLGKKKGMNGLGQYNEYEDYGWGLGIDAKGTAGDAQGLSADFLKEKSPDIMEKTVTAAGTSIVATSGAVPAAMPLTITALTPYGMDLAKEGAAYVAKGLLEGKKSKTTLDDVEKLQNAELNEAEKQANESGLKALMTPRNMMIAGGGLVALIAIVAVVKHRQNVADEEEEADDARRAKAKQAAIYTPAARAAAAGYALPAGSADSDFNAPQGYLVASDGRSGTPRTSSGRKTININM